MNCEEYTVQNEWEDIIFQGTILACDRQDWENPMKKIQPV